MIAVIVCLLAGLVLGQRFRVFVLLPGLALVVLWTLATGLVRTEAVWPSVLTGVCAAVSLQLGYFLGIAIRHVLAGGLARPTAAVQSGTGSAPARWPAR